MSNKKLQRHYNTIQTLVKLSNTFFTQLFNTLQNLYTTFTKTLHNCTNICYTTMHNICTTSQIIKHTTALQHFTQLDTTIQNITSTFPNFTKPDTTSKNRLKLLKLYTSLHKSVYKELHILYLLKLYNSLLTKKFAKLHTTLQHATQLYTTLNKQNITRLYKLYTTLHNFSKLYKLYTTLQHFSKPLHNLLTQLYTNF